MKSLEQMTIGQRIVLTFIIVLVILFALALFGWSTGGWDQAPAAVPLKLAPAHPSDVCGNEELQNKMRALMLGGLDEALRDRAQTLFEIWMKDETRQPERAATGLSYGVNAYVRARVSIEHWELQPCKTSD